jgi:hypothetical protein
VRRKEPGPSFEEINTYFIRTIISSVFSLCIHLDGNVFGCSLNDNHMKISGAQMLIELTLDPAVDEAF